MTLETWREQLRRGGLEMTILLSLAREPRYGLEIIRHLEETTDLVVTEGTVYPILARLARDRAVEAEWVTGEGPHPRKYYRLTSTGRRLLDAMLDHWVDFSRKVERLVAASGRRVR